MTNSPDGQSLVDFLNFISVRDSTDGKVEPKADVQERLRKELAIKSGSTSVSFYPNDVDAEVSAPDRFSVSSRQEEFVSSVLKALDEAARTLRQESAKRFELIVTGDFNLTQPGTVQFRICYSTS